MPPFLWLRFLTVEALMALHRHHFGARMHDAALEVSLRHGGPPQATSASLAEMLLGQLTSPTLAVRRAEMQARLQELLNAMDPIDREVLALRQFEELSNAESAAVLGLTKQAASNRYLRALKRLKEILTSLPGIDPNT
jgi:RNA polymerase sigma-70 factor (ECF subfamily)